MVIATIATFPLKAIQHRLRWAGLPAEKYALVTSYESMHFAKETVAYYPEVLAQLGWPDDPAVMVGDDFGREVKPTRAAGLPVFWVRKTEDVPIEAGGVPCGLLEAVKSGLKKPTRERCMSRLTNPRHCWPICAPPRLQIATLITALPERGLEGNARAVQNGA